MHLLLLSFLSLSWAQTNSSQPSPSLSSSLNSTTISGSLTSSAQFPTLSGYSPCVTDCLQTGIARVNCTSIVDVDCYCVKENFTREVFACIVDRCPAELMTEAKLAQLFCNLASSSPTLTFPSASLPTSSTSTAVPQSTVAKPTATASTAPPTLDTSGFLAALVYSILHIPYVIWSGA